MALTGIPLSLSNPFRLEYGKMDFEYLPSILVRQPPPQPPDNGTPDTFKTWILVFLIFLTVIFSSRVLLVLFFAAARKLFGRPTPNRTIVQEPPPFSSDPVRSQSNSHFLPTPPTTPPVVMLQSMMPTTRARPPGYPIHAYSSRQSMREHEHTHSNANLDDLNSFIVENEKKDDPCPVCLEPIGDQPVSTGQCLHLCHTSCMKSWLAKDRTVSCPVCRVTLHDAVSIDDTLQPKGERRTTTLTEVASNS